MTEEKLSGIVEAMPEEQYHAHPALSSTGARQLLKSPKVFDYMRSHPQEPKQAFDLGTAAHSKVLGIGARVITYPNEHLTPRGAVSTKAATLTWAEEQRAAGLVPISPDDAAKVDAMAEAVLANREARVLLEQDGTPEASVFATDPETGVDMRARFDFLPSFANTDPCAFDLKTTRSSAHPEEYTRTVANFGYHFQQEWYLHAYGIATGDFRLPMQFIVVETAAPHLVDVRPLALEYAEIARPKVRQALELFARYTEAGEWPDWNDPNRDPLQPPTWLMFQEGAIA